MTRRRRTALLLVGAHALSACRVYSPVARDGPAPATSVRVTLSDVGTVAVAPQLGPHVRVVGGRVTERAPGLLVVAVSEVTRADGGEQTFGGDVVRLAPDAVEQVGVVRTAAGRSWALGGVVLAAALAVAAAIHGGGGEGGPRTSGGSAPPR